MDPNLKPFVEPFLPTQRFPWEIPSVAFVWWLQLHLTSSNISHCKKYIKCMSVHWILNKNYMYCTYLDRFNLLTSSISASCLHLSPISGFTPWNTWVEHQGLASVHRERLGLMGILVTSGEQRSVFPDLYLKMLNIPQCLFPHCVGNFSMYLLYKWLPQNYINLWKETLPSENSE